MLYRIGTQAELALVADVFHPSILQELKGYIDVLDREYGSERDYLDCGGYAMLAQTMEDMLMVKDVVDYDVHPCEWATRLWKGTGYVSALYLMNNEFSILVFMPEVFAPTDVLEEMTD